jgi:hypothetical protein
MMKEVSENQGLDFLNWETQKKYGRLTPIFFGGHIPSLQWPMEKVQKDKQ